MLTYICNFFFKISVGILTVVLIGCAVVSLTTLKGSNSAYKDGKKRLRTHAPDDDELHDQEIYSAVVKSMAELEKATKRRHRLVRYIKLCTALI